MKIAILGKWHRYCSYFLMGSLEGAIQNGHSAMGVELIQDIFLVKQALLQYKPDIIFCHMLFSNEGSPVADKLEMIRDLKRKIGCRVYYQMGDPRIIPRYIKRVDDVLNGILIAHHEIEEYEKLNVPIHYFPYATLKSDFAIRKEQKYPLIFAGTMSTSVLYKERTRFIKKLEGKGIVEVFPKDGENTTFQTKELAENCLGFLNIFGRHDIKGFLGLRPFQFMGVGGLSIQKKTNGMEEVFENGIHHITFNNYNIEEIEEIFSLLTFDDIFKCGNTDIRKIGYEYCQKYHNYQIRMRDILEVIDGKRERVRYKLGDFNA